MAIATLERCYNNPQVFSGVVKIRKGETVRLMELATDIDSVKSIFSYYVSKVTICSLHVELFCLNFYDLFVAVSISLKKVPV